MRADPDWKAKAVSPGDAVAHIKSGMQVFVHRAAATPLAHGTLQSADLADVRLYHLHVSGDIPLRIPVKGDSFLFPLHGSGLAEAN
jgi:hypothetical protein